MMTEIEQAQVELNQAAIAWHADPDAVSTAKLHAAIANFRAAAAVVVLRAATHNPNEAR
jgi:hypothetical protein